MRHLTLMGVLGVVCGVAVVMMFMTAPVFGVLVELIDGGLRFAGWVHMPTVSLFFAYLCYCGLIAGLVVYKMNKAKAQPAMQRVR